jgi:hypothetical protein
MDQVREGCPSCFLTERAYLIEETGSPDEAIDAWEERAETVDLFFFETAIQWPIVFERLCHLHAEYGEATRAAQFCSRFVDLWADADPELQPRVRAAKQRLDALTGA